MLYKFRGGGFFLHYTFLRISSNLPCVGLQQSQKQCCPVSTLYSTLKRSPIVIVWGISIDVAKASRKCSSLFEFQLPGNLFFNTCAARVWRVRHAFRPHPGDWTLSPVSQKAGLVDPGSNPVLPLCEALADECQAENRTPRPLATRPMATPICCVSVSWLTYLV